MVSRSFDGVYFTEEPPRVEYRDRLFHVVYEVGVKRFEFVFLPRAFLPALKDAECAADQFYEEEGAGRPD